MTPGSPRSGDIAERIGRAVFTEVAFGMPVHDRPDSSVWACGNCPYLNVGPYCTKCGWPIGAGTLLPAEVPG